MPPVFLCRSFLPRVVYSLSQRKRAIKTQLIAFIDSPGVVRGVGGAEMLMALADVLDVDIVVVLYRENMPIPIAEEFAALQVPVLCLPASPEARAFTRLEKLERRLKLWEQFLAESIEETFLLNQFNILGTPPPL